MSEENLYEWIEKFTELEKIAFARQLEYAKDLESKGIDCREFLELRNQDHCMFYSVCHGLLEQIADWVTETGIPK